MKYYVSNLQFNERGQGIVALSGLSWQECYGSSNNHFLEPWWAEKHLKMTEDNIRSH